MPAGTGEQRQLRRFTILYIKKQSVHYRILRSYKDTLHGPSGAIRTLGPVNPNHVRYQLRYTRIFSFRHYTMAQGEKSKIFLSVVIYVVKAAFQPGLLTRRNPANARTARLSGLWLFLSWMNRPMLPNHPRYQLR